MGKRKRTHLTGGKYHDIAGPFALIGKLLRVPNYKKTSCVYA
jgi:hypothetical protein